MNNLILQTIKIECEKIEKGSGHGQVLITIQDGKVHLIKPTPYILMSTLDNALKNSNIINVTE